MISQKPLLRRDNFKSGFGTEVRFESVEQGGEAGKSMRAYFAELKSEREKAVAEKDAWEAREERILATAEDANKIASRALVISEKDLVAACSQARWAKWAAIVAAIAAIAANKENIISFFLNGF